MNECKRRLRLTLKPRDKELPQLPLHQHLLRGKNASLRLPLDKHHLGHHSLTGINNQDSKEPALSSGPGPGISKKNAELSTNRHPGTMSNIYYRKDAHKSIEGLLYALFVYAYLLDTSTFGLLLRCLVQDVSSSWKSHGASWSKRFHQKDNA